MRIWHDFKLFLRINGALHLVLTLFLYGIGMGILAPMNAIYLRESLGLGKVEIASIFAISLFLNMVLTIGVGIVSDSMKRKKTIPLLASVVCMIGLVIYMNADSYAQALIGMALATAPSGMIMGQLFAMARNHVTRLAPDIVEMAQIWMRATYSVGFFTGLLVGANLYLLATFHGVLWGNLAGYASLFLLLLFYKEITLDSSTASAKAGEPFSLIMLFAILLLSCADAIRGLYLPLVVNEQFGDPRLMSFIWSIQAVFELLFMTMAGYWAAKYGSKPIIMLGGLFALITYIAYSTSDSLTVFFLMQPLYSFFVSVLYGVAMGYVQRMFIHKAGFGASLYVFISQTASLIGYFLPLFIDGVTPQIFWIPAALIVASMGLMTRALYTGRQQQLSA
ncbi:MFS transporter [Paenibacillus sp. E194]|jgi:MFS transporter, SET family, sugar efflux transporter|uniref:MFS transporter n=1 Tax=Paenibacillus sp. E194 TaxID=1458845 RepID=UPI0005C8DF76|nr:MFS transporter [Paenibacillus sp. E194]KJB87823.1 MFS transporter [Paenibacillus sp. E194]